MRDFLRTLSILAVFLLSGPTLATAYGQSRLAPQGNLPFNLYAGYLILVQGSAGPLKGLNFLVDTGASPAILDTRLADRLHLEQKPAILRVVGGNVRAASSTVSSLHVGPVEQENLPVFIEDLSSMQRAIAVRLDGIIGLDVLGHGAFVIDYPAQQIHFGPTPAFANPLPLRIKNGLAIIDADINGMRAALMMDTAAPSVFLFPRNPPGQPMDLRVSDSGSIGQFARKPIKVRSFRLGATDFGGQKVSLAPGGSADFDGLLSPVALGIRQVAIDLGRGEVAFIR
jgi:hypothetical protein